MGTAAVRGETLGPAPEPSPPLTPGPAPGAGPAFGAGFTGPAAGAVAHARDLRPAQVLALQREAGNAAVARVLAATRQVARAPLGEEIVAALEAAAAAPGPGASPEPGAGGARAAGAEPEAGGERGDGAPAGAVGAGAAGPEGRAAEAPVATPDDPAAAAAASVAEGVSAAPEAAAAAAAGSAADATSAAPEDPAAAGPGGEGAAAPGPTGAAAGPAGAAAGPTGAAAGPTGAPAGAAAARPDGSAADGAPAAPEGPAPGTEDAAALGLPPALAGAAVAPAPALPDLPRPALARQAAGASPDAAAPPRVLAREGEEEDGGGLLGSITRRISGVVGGLQSGWSSLTETAEEAVAGVRDRYDAVTEGLGSLASGVISRVEGLWESVRETAGGLADGLRHRLGEAFGGLGGAVAAIRAALTKLDPGGLSAAWEGLTGLVGGAWSALSAGRAALGERLSGLWNGLQEGFTGGMAGLVERGSAMIGDLRSAASGVTGRLGAMWEGLTSTASGLAGEGGGLLARAIRAAVERVVSAGQRVWGGIQGQWTALRQRASGWLSTVTDGAQGVWDGLKRRASGVWSTVTGAWQGVKAGVTAAADRLTGGVRGLWERLQGLSLGPVIEKLAAYAPAIRTIQAAADDPEAALTPFVGSISGQLEGTPAKAQEIIGEHAGGGAAPAEGPQRTPAPSAAPAAGAVLARTPATGASARAVQRQEVARGTATWSEMWQGLVQAVSQKWAQLDVGQLVKDMLWTLVWPWPTVGKELSALWTDWGHAVDSLFLPRNPLSDPLGCLHDVYSNVLKIYDFPLVLWRRLMNIGMALMGWVTVFLMIAGAVQGAAGGTIVGAVAGALAGLGIGAAPGAGGGAAAGGVAGAGAGFAAALGIGQALVIGYAAGEATALGKALLELKTGRQTPDEQARDYNQVADSGIGLAILAILVLLAWMAGRLASMAVSRLARVMPEAVRDAAARFGEGMRSVQGEKPGTGRSDEVTDPAADQAKRTFDDINPANAPSGYRFTDTLTMEGEVKVIRTEVTAPDGSTGWIERAFDPTTGKFEMRNAFLDEIPKDLRVLTLEGGQTMPLVDYLTLRQMKLIDAPFGGIVTVKMSTIQNARTVAHVAGQAKKGVPPETSIRGTHSVTYAERSIAGSGHRVRSAKIVEGTGRTDPFDVMLEWYETRGNPGGPRDAKMQAAHDKILTQEGVSRTDPVLWDFDIVIELEPVAQPGGGGAGAGAGTPAGSSPTTVVGPPSPSEESDREPVPVP